MNKVFTLALALVFGAVSVYAKTPGGTDITSPGVADPAQESVAQTTPPTQGVTATQTTPPARQKSMATTVLLGLLIPGGGNFYTGDKKRGFIVLGAAIGGIALAASSMQTECGTTSYYLYCNEGPSGGRYYAGLGIAAGANLFGLISAVSRASDINSGKITAFDRLRINIPSRKGGLKVAYNFNF